MTDTKCSADRTAPVKIDIIGGFLGAGKTTFINKLLSDGLGSERIVIVENEFGNEAVDSDLIDQGNFEMRTLPSGCICCTLKADFITSIVDIVDNYLPDRIVIEPTGLAGPDELEETCSSDYIARKLSVPVRMNSMTTIVDAQDVEEMIEYAIPVYLAQLEQARFIVLSHTQDMDAAACASAIAAIEQVAPAGVTIIDTPWDAIDGLELLGLSEEAYAARQRACADEECACDHAADSQNEHEHDHEHGNDRAHAHRHGHAGFTSRTLYPTRTFDDSDVSALGDALSGAGVLRAKGFLPQDDSMLHYEYVNGRARTTPSAYAGAAKLVVIGEQEAIDRLDEAAMGL